METILYNIEKKGKVNKKERIRERKREIKINGEKEKIREREKKRLGKKEKIREREK